MPQAMKFTVRFDANSMPRVKYEAIPNGHVRQSKQTALHPISSTPSVHRKKLRYSELSRAREKSWKSVRKLVV